jgi:hypothetical protein
LNNEILPPGYSAMVEQHADCGIPDILALEVAAPPANGADANTTGVPSGLVSVATAPPKVPLEATYSSAFQGIARRTRDRLAGG